MSQFNRWWSKQHNNDKAAKQFASIVWSAANEPYKKSMRLHCKEHGYMDEKTGPMAECPYCRIEELEDIISGKTFYNIENRTAERCVEIVHTYNPHEEHKWLINGIATEIRKEFNL